MEVPGLRVELELQLLACTTAAAMWDHGNAGSLTYRVRPGIEPASSWILVRLITAEPRRELPTLLFPFPLLTGV